MEVKWSNPYKIDLSKKIGLIYFIKIVDGVTGDEYRYIGQTKRGKSRFREYKNNIRKIFEGKPRRATKGQEKYRPVHLALAKACENGWKYDFYPLENVDIKNLNKIEKQRVTERKCKLNNIKKSWLVEDYNNLSIADLFKK